MLRIDRRNHIKSHYFYAICGFISFTLISIFLISALFFSDFISSYGVNEQVLKEDFSDPSEFAPFFIGLPAVFFLYYYVLLRSRKIFFDEIENQYVVNGMKCSRSEVFFSNEFIYFGLCFCFVSLGSEKRRCVFISKSGVDMCIFGVRKNKWGTDPH